MDSTLLATDRELGVYRLSYLLAFSYAEALLSYQTIPSHTSGRLVSAILILRL